jgi:uncharacterized protein
MDNRYQYLGIVAANILVCWRRRGMDAKEIYLDAVKNGAVEVVRRCLEQEPGMVNLRTEEGFSAVMLAAYYQKQEVLQLLLERNPELTLFEAAAVGDADRVRELVDQEPESVNGYAGDGFQPLGLASFFGHAQVAELLIEKGADVNTPSQNAQHVAPLHSAAAGRHLEIAEMLLNAGADPNARQADGFTPLHSAAQNGDAKLARLLLDSGAYSSPENDRGQTPLDMAAAMGHQEVTELLGGSSAEQDN